MPQRRPRSRATSADPPQVRPVARRASLPSLHVEEGDVEAFDPGRTLADLLREARAKLGGFALARPHRRLALPQRQCQRAAVLPVDQADRALVARDLADRGYHRRPRKADSLLELLRRTAELACAGIHGLGLPSWLTPDFVTEVATRRGVNFRAARPCTRGRLVARTNRRSSRRRSRRRVSRRGRAASGRRGPAPGSTRPWA